jgi:hypothetical protein
MAQIRRIVVLASVTVLAIGAWTLPVSAQTTATAAVTPNIGLVDGQTVSVTATGLRDVFLPAILECEPAVDPTSLNTVLDDCGFRATNTVVVDADGNLPPTDITVEANLTLMSNEHYDCLARNDCVILVGGLGFPSFIGAVAPIKFAVHPATKADCRHGGYRTFVDGNDHLFKAQGACIAYVNHH